MLLLYPVKLQVSIMSRVSTLPPVKATVLVLHWIRFVSWLKAQVVVPYVYIITYILGFVKPYYGFFPKFPGLSHFPSRVFRPKTGIF